MARTKRARSKTRRNDRGLTMGGNDNGVRIVTTVAIFLHRRGLIGRRADRRGRQWESIALIWMMWKRRRP